MTDYRALGELIDAYNAIAPEHAIDRTVVDLRDALAHGRVSAPHPTDDFVLLKFDRPSGGFTRVAYAQAVTEEWLAQEEARVATQFKKVAGAPGSPIFPV
jgi:hypothetical protein